MSKAANAVTPLSYRRSESPMISDHKPVSAFFDCNVRVVDLIKERQFFKDLVVGLEYWNSPEPPLAEIQGIPIILPAVRYQSKIDHKIVVKNTGNSLIYWHFVPKLEDKKHWKRWMLIKVLGPHDKLYLIGHINQSILPFLSLHWV
jgi:inositol polyphosphate 5-phosphatase INPP5B/F